MLKQCEGFDRGQKKRGESGNLVRNICPVTVMGHWVSGDQIEVDTGPVGTIYTSVKAVSPGVAGLVADIGIYDHVNANHDPDFFGADHDFTSAGSVEKLTNGIPVNMRSNTDTAVRHSIIFTLKADPPSGAVGKTVYLITDAEYTSG
jgi:hypothetical protein